jgi:hypothetical protein
MRTKRLLRTRRRSLAPWRTSAVVVVVVVMVLVEMSLSRRSRGTLEEKSFYSHCRRIIMMIPKHHQSFLHLLFPSSAIEERGVIPDLLRSGN